MMTINKKGSKKCAIIITCMLILCTLLSFPMQTQAAFNRTKAKKNVTVTYKQLPNGILAIYKNKNKSAIKLTATVNFCDGDKKSISKEKQTNLCLTGKSTAALFFNAPRDEYGNAVNYSSFKGSFSVSKSKYKSYSKKINISSELDAVEGSFAAINMSGKRLSSIHATIIFYDGNGEMLDCSTKYLNCYEKNAIDQFKINYAGESYQPSKVKIYVDWAY